MPRDRCAQRLALRRHGTHATRADRENSRPAPHTAHPARVAACAGGQQSRRPRDLVHRTFIPRSESFQNGRVILAACRPASESGLLGAPWGLLFAANSPPYPVDLRGVLAAIPAPGVAADSGRRLTKPRAPPARPRRPSAGLSVGTMGASPSPRPAQCTASSGWSGPGTLVRCLARSAFEEPCRSLPPSSHGASPAPADPAANASTPPTPGSSCSSTSRPRRRFHPC